MFEQTLQIEALFFTPLQFCTSTFQHCSLLPPYLNHFQKCLCSWQIYTRYMK